jgi:hypothetical protein
MVRTDSDSVADSLHHATLHIVASRNAFHSSKDERVMRHNKVVSKRNGLVNNGFRHVQTQQCPCNFRLCQSYLQAGIVPSVLQGQWRESFKGTHNLLNFHSLENENLGAKILIFFEIPSVYGEK